MASLGPPQFNILELLLYINDTLPAYPYCAHIGPTYTRETCIKPKWVPSNAFGNAGSGAPLISEALALGCGSSICRSMILDHVSAVDISLVE